ncbi:MAG: hypothetical protein HOL66_13105 [Rhodospirillaceae bacterium]|jgi:hypothetical protein|nr:hypothetical protein [Rhodospirillaceae bacterium]MBT5245169.1 hypothetical protein [Rhodospirillaceae bacterium]MBT6241987.1 hypothetical protein [Rhodospirillaceae bacterium]
MDEDFTDFHKDFGGQALFLPSMHVSYINAISKEIRDIRPDFNPRHLVSMQMLNFFNEEHGLFFYPWALYSAGVANLDMDRAAETESSIYNRDRDKTFLMVDSGGFQVVTGALKINGRPFDWANPDEGRMQILRWQEAIGDVATVLDVPTFAIQKDTPFKTFNDCLAQTNDNLRFIDDNRTNKVPFINVLQGDNNSEIQQWYDGVNWFPASGWAFAGGTKLNLYNLLRTIIMLRDDGALEGDKGKWLHILGVGKPAVGAVLTIIQKAIRENVNSETMVTLDASNPFQEAGLRGSIQLHYTFSNTQKATRGVTENFEDLLPYCDPDKGIPEAFGPVLKTSGIPAREIFIQNADGTWRNKEKDGKRASDAISYATIMAHNTYMLLDEFLTNNLMFAGVDVDDGTILNAKLNGIEFETSTEANFHKITKIINKVFKTEHTGKELEKNHTFLEKFIIWNPH